MSHPHRVNLASRRFKADPYPFYAKLRAQAPVYRTTLPGRRPAWLVTRYAREDLELEGVAIPRGGLVLGVLASANRDERQFAQADCLDLGREANHHLAFGQGMHYCLGAPLARLETQVALTTLLRHLPELRLDLPAQQLRWNPGLFVRGIEQLRVALPA